MCSLSQICHFYFYSEFIKEFFLNDMKWTKTRLDNLKEANKTTLYFSQFFLLSCQEETKWVDMRFINH